MLMLKPSNFEVLTLKCRALFSNFDSKLRGLSRPWNSNSKLRALNRQILMFPTFIFFQLMERSVDGGLKPEMVVRDDPELQKLPLPTKEFHLEFNKNRIDIYC